MKLHRAMTIISLIALQGILLTVRSQEPSSSIGRLEEEIAKVTAIERKIGTPQDLRSLNRSFLEERQVRLRALLAQKIATLQDYRQLVSLTLSESRILDESVRALKRELGNLNDNIELGTTSPRPAPLAMSASSSWPAEAVRRFSTDVASASPIPPVASDKQKKGKGNPDIMTIRVDDPVPNGLSTSLVTISGDSEDPKFDPAMNNLITNNTNLSGANTNDYCIVHIVQWNGVKIQQDAWFLYEKADKAWERQTDYDGKRIYGSKRVAVLLIHLGTPGGQDITYKISVNKKTPAPFLHLMTLVGAIAGPAAAQNLWAAKFIIVENVPSDIVVSASISITGEQNKEITRTYDNEGRYRWDVSVGVPVKTIRELQFSSDGNKVTTAAKERQDVYGFLNIYPVPVDVSGDNLPTAPHFVFGVPLASKPLHHPFAGIGYGVYKTPIKFNIYAGVIFNRERVPRTLTIGSNANTSQLEADLHTRWVRKFTWGISFPVGQIKNAIKK